VVSLGCWKEERWPDERNYATTTFALMIISGFCIARALMGLEMAASF
jgi:hypothetical protein